MTKQVLRQRVLKKLRSQSKEERLRKSLKIARRLHRLTAYRKAAAILCYVAIDAEVETRPILSKALADGKRVAVPVTLHRNKKLVAAEIANPGKDLDARGPFGIPEPTHHSRCQVNPKDLDLVLVPGVAFDRSGRRLGRGGGYFDRFLSQLPHEIPRIGLAFRFQVVKKIPWELHDQPVSRVITD